MKKRLLSIIALVLLMAIGVCPNLYAAQTEVKERTNETMIVMLINAYQPRAVLGFSGKTASCNGSILVKDGVTKVDGTLKLERKNSSGSYTQVNSWTASTSGSDLYMSESASVTGGYTYRLTFTAKVYKGSSYETVSTQTSGSC